MQKLWLALLLAILPCFSWTLFWRSPLNLRMFFLLSWTLVSLFQELWVLQHAALISTVTDHVICIWSVSLKNGRLKLRLVGNLNSKYYFLLHSTPSYYRQSIIPFTIDTLLFPWYGHLKPVTRTFVNKLRLYQRRSG